MNNSTIEHDAMNAVMPFHSELTVHSNDINISDYVKIPKIDENPLIIDFAFWSKYAIFAMCLKH